MSCLAVRLFDSWGNAVGTAIGLVIVMYILSNWRRPFDAAFGKDTPQSKRWGIIFVAIAFLAMILLSVWAVSSNT